MKVMNNPFFDDPMFNKSLYNWDFMTKMECNTFSIS